MSDASNLGYGNIIPNSNVNNNFVNVAATNNPAGFSSNESGLAASAGHGMMGATNNAAAAAGCLGGYCNMTTMQKGGRRGKMRGKYMSSRRHRRRSRKHRHTRRTRRHRGGAATPSMGRQMALYRRRMASLSRKLARSQSRRGGGTGLPALTPAPFESGQKGGYHQYMGNVPATATYSVAGQTLGAANSALANPAPITKLSNCTNCVDNYNHYPTSGHPNGSGFQLWN